MIFKILFSFFLAIFLPFSAIAQEESQTTESTGSVVVSGLSPECNKSFVITGNRQIRANSTQEYGIQNDNGQVLPFGTFYIDYNGEKTENSVEREKLSYTFSQPGKATISLALDENVHQCKGKLTAEIEIFAEKIVYLGVERAELTDANMAQIFREKSVLFEPIFTGENFKLENQPNILSSLTNADIIVINSRDVITIFNDIEKMQRLRESSFSQKKFFIISDYQKNFLSKVLASPLAHLKIDNISVISSDQLNTLLNQWSWGNNRSVTLGEHLSYEKSGFAFTMNSFLEYLAYAGISYEFLGFLLTLAVVAVVFNIFKQVIGFDVFSIYHPMLLAIIISQIGLAFGLAFILIAVISFYIVKFITNKIQLLYNARKSFLISVYILMTLLALSLDNVLGTGFFYSTMFESPLAIIAIFAILFIVEKIIENIKFFSKSGIFLIIQYIFVVAVACLILQSKSLQYFLISFPDLIFVIVIVNFLVGRYMGLQIVEYIRFLPILRSLDSEEE